MWPSKFENMDAARILKASDAIYCPYTDRELPRERVSTEHVIPLSLGGADPLGMPVDKSANATFGSELDGVLANDFLMALRRTEYDARGQSGKEPWATIRNATYGDFDRPAQVHIHRKHGLRLWDARDKQFWSGAGSIRLRTTMNVELPVRFVAKTALAAGYFVYGDLFRHDVDHEQLRVVMRTNLAKLDQATNRNAKHAFEQLTLRADHYLAVSEARCNVRVTYCSSKHNNR